MKKLNTSPFLCLHFIFALSQLLIFDLIPASYCAPLPLHLRNGNYNFPELEFYQFNTEKNTEHQAFSDFFIPCDSTDKIDLVVSAGLSRPKSGFNHIGGVLLNNSNYNGAHFINLTVSYDTTALLISTNYPPVSSSPGHVVFYIDTLLPFEKKNITLEFNTPSDSVFLNHFLWLVADVNSNSYDLDLANNKDSTSNKITAAYDPNAKSVMPEGFGPSHYVPLTQEEFKYTIDFQNTGTDTAINITIIDTISSFLDPLTIQPGASSHPYSWELLSPGILKFHFTNIFLPDSNVNEPRSHGFVSFIIKAIPGLSAGTFIKNNAYLYFDFNTPVITNTVVNELFDCNNITNFSLSQNTICSGDQLFIFQNSLVPHTSNWYIDTAWQAAGDSFIFNSQVKGMHQVTLIAQTPYCNQSVMQSIYVIVPIKPTISQNGLVLTSTPATAYQWLQGTTPIPGAQSASYQVLNQGWYAVKITDGNGCEATSDSVYVTNVGLPGYSDADVIEVFPNPFSTYLEVQTELPNSVTIEISDLEGRILIKERNNRQNRKFIINTSSLSSGIYSVRVTGNGFVNNRIITKN